jgi:hypothetical protein
MVICNQQDQKYTQQHSASDWIYALLQKKKAMHNVRDNNPSFHHIHVAEEGSRRRKR